MMYNNHRGFSSGYFLFLLFVMVFFGWQLFYFFPLLWLLWIPLFTFDAYEYEEVMEKPKRKRKPKNDDYYSDYA